ncbi:MAG: carboxypeptidase-like regulatory domain-containing protein, partial [Acidobacteria bacterium]|nr:carboxypeptidase-like regulatory domain-containing protein [Acidobacteriota bacterium]
MPRWLGRRVSGTLALLVILDVTALPSTSVRVAAAAQTTTRPQPADAAGTIRGRVTDDAGHPVAGCRVSVGSIPAGDQVLLALPLAIRTDANGEYEVPGVPAGEWHLKVEHDAIAPGGLSADHPDYATVFFPGVTDARNARRVRVVGGAPVVADVVMLRITVYELALRLAPVDLLRSNSLELFINAAAAGRPRAISPRDVEPDGTVRFKRLRPGPYFVWARVRAGDGVLVAWQNVVVTDRSLQLDFPLVPAGRLAGRIVAPDLEAISGARVVASLVHEGQPVDFREPDTAVVSSDGGFVIDGLFG